jgi:NAD(P)-dependent dehydrogenase (short-subunit alcohol dehydrogenase family)
VLITGASRGIGAQIARQYARTGASLSLAARTQSALDASKDAILGEHPSAKVLTFPTDVRDVNRAEEVVAATVAHFGHLNILVTNAGGLRAMDKRTLRLPTGMITATLQLTCVASESIRVERSHQRAPSRYTNMADSMQERSSEFGSLASSGCFVFCPGRCVLHTAAPLFAITKCIRKDLGTSTTALRSGKREI